jgi:hypothetical protein
MIELNFRSILPLMLLSFHFASIVGLYHFSFFQPGLHFLMVQSGSNHSATWEFLDFVSAEPGEVGIATPTKKFSQEEVLLQRFHVFFECRRAEFGLDCGLVDIVVEILVVHQCSDRSLRFHPSDGLVQKIRSDFLPLLLRHDSRSGPAHEPLEKRMK